MQQRIVKTRGYIVKTNEEFEQNYKQHKNFEYKKLVSIKNFKFIEEFAFNTNNTILFVGQRSGEINIYGFNNRRKLVQTLNYSFWNVTSLIWGKKSNLLVAGHDYQIVLWELDKYNQLRPQWQIKLRLTCMILNENEDLMVIGGEQYQIQFWEKQYQEWVCSKVFETYFDPRHLSMSPSQNKLVVSGMTEEDNIIQVFEQQINQIWIITQTISINSQFNQHNRVCFVTDTQFVFHIEYFDFFQIFDYQQETGLFVETQEVEIQMSFKREGTFSWQFINERNILVIKQQTFLNFFSRDKNSNYFLQYIINLKNHYIYGRLSDDGIYLVTWDQTGQYLGDLQGSHEIQIRKIRLNDLL